MNAAGHLTWTRTAPGSYTTPDGFTITREQTTYGMGRAANERWLLRFHGTEVARRDTLAAAKDSAETAAGTAYTDPRHEAAAKPLAGLIIRAWQAADSTATLADIAAALAPLGVLVDVPAGEV